MTVCECQMTVCECRMTVCECRMPVCERRMTVAPARADFCRQKGRTGAENRDQAQHLDRLLHDLPSVRRPHPEGKVLHEPPNATRHRHTQHVAQPHGRAPVAVHGEIDVGKLKGKRRAVSYFAGSTQLARCMRSIGVLRSYHSCCKSSRAAGTPLATEIKAGMRHDQMKCALVFCDHILSL